MRWLVSLLVNGVAVFVAAQLLNSIEVDGFGSALIAALILAVINTFIRPILVFFTLPLTIVSLGLFLLVINAVTFFVTGMLVPGFEVTGFWGAFWGAMIVSVVSWILNSIFRS